MISDTAPVSGEVRPASMRQPAADRRAVRPSGVPPWPATLAAMALLCAAAAIWIDVPLADYALGHPPGVRAAALAVSALGLSGYMFAGAAAVGLGAFWIARRESAATREGLMVLAHRALFVFATLAVSGLLVQILKHLVGRARPGLMKAHGAFHLDPFSIKASLASFPSGHATSIFALAMALSLLMPRLRWVFLSVALLVAASRTLVGSHYLSDVIAGAALGSVVCLIAAQRFKSRDLVFVRDRSGFWLKGRGEVGPALRATLRRRTAA